MPRKSNLIQRGGRWYFNRAIPKDLWPSLGKAPFRLSLQTDSLEIAIRRRPDAERQYFAKVDAARAVNQAVQPRQLSMPWRQLMRHDGSSRRLLSERASLKCLAVRASTLMHTLMVWPTTQPIQGKLSAARRVAGRLLQEEGLRSAEDLRSSGHYSTSL